MAVSPRFSVIFDRNVGLKGNCLPWKRGWERQQTGDGPRALSCLQRAHLASMVGDKSHPVFSKNAFYLPASSPTSTLLENCAGECSVFVFL